MTSTQHLHYWLATSAVEFTGTRTVTTSPHEPTTTAFKATASLVTRADMSAQRQIFDLTEGNLHETKASLSFTPDGRLCSTSLQTTGTGGTILAAISTIVAEAIGAVAGAGERIATTAEVEAPEAPVAPPTADRWSQDALLHTLTAGEDGLASALASLAATLPDGAHPDDGTRLEVIDKALTMVAAQRDRLTKERLVWLDRKEATTSYRYVLDGSALPTSADLLGGLDPTSAAFEVWEHLHLVATVDGVGDESKPDPTAIGPGDDPDPTSAIWYREPRRLKVSVWERQEGRSAAPRLVSQQVVDWVDAHSTHRPVPLHKGSWFAENQMSATFGANGAVASIGREATPGLAAASSAIAGLPQDVTTGLGDMTGLGAAWSAAHPSARQREIEALTDRHTLLSLEAQNRGLEDAARRSDGAAS